MPTEKRAKTTAPKPVPATNGPRSRAPVTEMTAKRALTTRLITDQKKDLADSFTVSLGRRHRHRSHVTTAQQSVVAAGPCAATIPAPHAGYASPLSRNRLCVFIPPAPEELSPPQPRGGRLRRAQVGPHGLERGHQGPHVVRFRAVVRDARAQGVDRAPEPNGRDPRLPRPPDRNSTHNDRVALRSVSCHYDECTDLVVTFS